MPDQISNGSDRDPCATRTTGQAESNAALLLVESLIHGLIARSILSVEEAINIIEIAADVEQQLDDSRMDSKGGFQSVLIPLAQSLSADLNG